jgi:predicted enzyme related to lactoylglutathione lyase
VINVSTSKQFQVKGPDFIALQVRDLDVAKRFYTEVVGLELAPQSPPDAVVFKTQPIDFAIRKPIVNLAEATILGHGVSLWLGVENVSALHEQLLNKEVTIARPIADSPFGKTFTFRDPDGYLITIHEA